jgi:hypothetical protein
MKNSESLFTSVSDGYVIFANKQVLEDGDYQTVAIFAPRSLELTWFFGPALYHDQSIVESIRASADDLRARRGDHFEISTSGQTEVLGFALETDALPEDRVLKHPNAGEELSALDGSQPHFSWGGWENFLETCDLRDEQDGVRFFGKTNCNYLVFPHNVIIENFGYHGKAVMRNVKENGWKHEYNRIVTTLNGVRDCLQKPRYDLVD